LFVFIVFAFVFFRDKHEPNHRPAFHKGVVIKKNSNQRYATSNITSFPLIELAKRNGIPVQVCSLLFVLVSFPYLQNNTFGKQDFVVRNDGPCGTTIGPILSANAGIRTVDIGNPQFSMHSIREMCGTGDVAHAIALLRVYYEQFTALDEQLIVD
jgi:aspartyl aminopeptidase